MINNIMKNENSFWNRYGGYILAGVIAAGLATGYIELGKYKDISKRYKEAASKIKVLRNDVNHLRVQVDMTNGEVNRIKTLNKELTDSLRSLDTDGDGNIDSCDLTMLVDGYGCKRILDIASLKK